jgi:tetratricopeptide (TPR) repeat protein
MAHRRFDAPAVLLAVGLVAAVGREAWATEGVVYLEQPTAISREEYIKAWPSLEEALQLPSPQDTAAAEALLRRARPTDAALNVVAQLARQHGRLGDAERDIQRAITLAPNQHLHYFQLAMISYAHLQAASGKLDRWKWHRKTRAAYKKAFELEPRGVSYRYYLAYSYLQEPRLMGGSTEKALQMAEEGIRMGLAQFYVVRADAHRFRGELGEAFADYDRSIQAKIFKLNSFVAATTLALDKRDMERARRYADWSVSCRPDSAMTHEVLGDYYALARDRTAAERAYRNALTADPGCSTCRDKLTALTPEP